MVWVPRPMVPPQASPRLVSTREQAPSLRPLLGRSYVTGGAGAWKAEGDTPEDPAGSDALGKHR